MEELIHHFGIDWKLLLAQMVNFFILLFLLKKFAYKPIINILKKRKDEIKKGVLFTRKAEEELKNIGVVREQSLQKTREEALSIVTKAEEDGKKRKDGLLKEANTRVEEIMADAKRLIEEEKLKMGDEVYRNAQELIKLGLEKVLGKMPEKERNENLIKEALKELKTTH